MTIRTVIDLFSGAGGLSEGFKQAGYSVLAGNDNHSYSGETFSQTHPGSIFFPEPIQDLTPTKLLRRTGIRKGELDCLVGGPPCQAYSVYNHQRGMHDQRSSLFREYLRMVGGLNPRWVVMENVTGITSAGNGRAFRAVISGLKSLGYTSLKTVVLNAEDYGVPQERRRMLFVGNRVNKDFCWPEKTHGPDLHPYVTINDAIGDLPNLENGEDAGPRPYRTKPKSSYQELLRGGESLVFNHAAPRLAPINMQRMKHIPQGGSWRDIPVHLLPEGMKRARRCDHTKRYGRLRPDGLASTILTKCDIHWGAYIHPNQDRALTVREAARLQSFPDSYHFAGPRTEQYVQVGNAVPPLLALRIAESVTAADSGSRSRNDVSQSLMEFEVAV